MKLSKEEKAVAFAGAILDAPRFVDIGVALHGAKITHEIWSAIHGATSGVFSLVVAASIVISFGALARAKQRGVAFYALLVSLSLMLVSVGTAVYCALRNETGAIFTAAAVVAPLLVISNVPLAAMLRETESATGETSITIAPRLETGADLIPVSLQERAGVAQNQKQGNDAVLPDDPQNRLFRYTKAQQAFLDAVNAGGDPNNTDAMADLLHTSPAAVRALRSKLRSVGALQTKQEMT